MFFMRGKTQEDAPAVEAGDIVAIAKLQSQRPEILSAKRAI